MPTSEHKYQCFFILVQGFSACTFSRIIDCFHCRLLSVWSYIFLLIAQTRSQNKTTFTTTKSHECLQRTAISQQNFFCSLSQELNADWLRKAVQFFLNWTVSLFVKESFDWQDKIAQQENVLKANFQALTARVNGKTKLSK